MTAEEAYSLGLRYLRAGYYTKALEQLNRVRTYYRDDPYALKAELAIADVHFKRNEYDAARIAYEDFMRAHPRYRELDYVVYRLGDTIAKGAPTVAARDQARTRQAVNAWTGFAARFPDSDHREAVEAGLGKLRNRLGRKELVVARFYARRKAWPAVAGRARGLLELYPTSPDRPEALALLAEAYARSGQAELAALALERLRGEAPGSRFERRVVAAIEDGAAADTK